jgi:DNA repair protein RadA/Sms
MAKTKTKFVCSNCGHEAPKWFGRCPSCQEWETAVEQSSEAAPAGKRAVSERRAPPAAFTSVLEAGAAGEIERMSSGIPELDRVLGGGFVPGFYGLIAGEPGAGKSTLTNQLAVAMSRAGRRVGIASGEESNQQIKLRLDRLTDNNTPDIGVSNEVSAERLYQSIAGGEFDLLIIDSVNTVFSEEVPGEPGGPQQMRACAAIFQRAAKEHGTSVFLVGQVTKDNAVAGPRMLEHAVDAFLIFEGDRREQYRILRAMKNRFGSTDEIGVFEMTGHGLEAVEDPSALFVTGRDFPAPGAVVTAAIEGTRPVLCEIQALVNPSNLPQPVRASRGLDVNRSRLLLAVLARKAGYRKLGQSDVFLNVAGGLKVDEPSIDLAVCAAIASAATGRPVKDKLCVIGEVTLLGEVRRPNQADRRAHEAERQGLETPPFEGKLADVLEKVLVAESIEENLDDDE